MTKKCPAPMADNQPQHADYVALLREARDQLWHLDAHKMPGRGACPGCDLEARIDNYLRGLGSEPMPDIVRYPLGLVGECVCDDPENFCGGADIDTWETGYCQACTDLDGEAHCLRCPFECCAEETT